ncbi:MAG: hypothetical protein IK000_01180 [Bacteroidaceae bacterium]|nr:hypothetical protein [Bacteroidaceae bacterium]
MICKRKALQKRCVFVFPDEMGSFSLLQDFVRKLFTFIFQEVLFTRAKIRVSNVLSKKKFSHFSHILHTGALARRYFFPKNPDEMGGFDSLQRGKHISKR